MLTQVVNPEVQLADVHLRVLGPGLRLLQPHVDLLDLLLRWSTNQNPVFMPINQSQLT